ncbi:MAG: hypothetical protein AB1646_20750 [Thermodesulfobacteriota bacterium]
MDPRTRNAYLDKLVPKMTVTIWPAHLPGLFPATFKDRFFQEYFPGLEKGQEPEEFQDYSLPSGSSALDRPWMAFCSPDFTGWASPAGAAGQGSGAGSGGCGGSGDSGGCGGGGDGDIQPGDSGQCPASYCDAPRLPAAPKEQAALQRRDPLVLDLDGNGIQTTREGRAWSEGRAFFDLNSDGFAERTGWVSANDGLLVWDRNDNGFIDDGRELFGSGTALTAGGAASTGFQALADLDSNHDGIISSTDAAFSLLRVWKDQDEDGFSFPTDLYTLEELGIASINLTPAGAGSGTDAQGNTQDRVGTFTWADGSSGQIAEYTFAGYAGTIVTNTSLHGTASACGKLMLERHTHG